METPIATCWAMTTTASPLKGSTVGADGVRGAISTVTAAASSTR